jgi:hypothetical protein
MGKLINTVAIIGIASFAITGCKKETKPVVQQAVSAEVLAQIKALGFSNTNVEIIDEGYLVEGDIVLTPQDLTNRTPVTALRVANTEQYRTTNLVTGLPRNITVALSSRLPSSYVAVLDEMISRYNAEGLRITFSRVSSGATITFDKANGSYLASAGFPDAQGNPYHTVKVNSRAIGTGTNATFINYAATIFAHEVGHCIGFRHTDYMDRSYSCGGGYSNEGASTVGAINIPGTPTTAEPNSWMLACISANQNRPFDSYDKTALAYLYK